jgi:hypothetical protein
MSGGRKAPAKPLGPRQSAAAAYAVDLVITGKDIDVNKAISLARRRPGWRNAPGLSKRNIYTQVQKRQQRDAAAEVAIWEERAAAAAMCETKDLVDIIEFYKHCDEVIKIESIEDEIQRLKSDRDDLFARIGMLEEMVANR